MSLTYRVYISQGKGTNRWLEFEAPVVSHNLFGPTSLREPPGPGDDAVRNEVLAGQELRTIKARKQFRVVPDTDDAHIVHDLLTAVQTHWNLDLTIELVRSTSGGPKIGVTIVALELTAKATSFVVLDDDFYSFNFQIIGGTKETDYDE